MLGVSLPIHSADFIEREGVANFLNNACKDEEDSLCFIVSWQTPPKYYENRNNLYVHAYLLRDDDQSILFLIDSPHVQVYSIALLRMRLLERHDKIAEPCSTLVCRTSEKMTFASRVSSSKQLEKKRKAERLQKVFSNDCLVCRHVLRKTTNWSHASFGKSSTVLFSVM